MSSDRNNLKLIYCGLVSGVMQAGVFNFWDRALFLSVKENRPFLDAQNFVKPFTGMLQSLIQRTVSGGLYFPLEDIYRDILIRNYALKDESYYRFAAGTLAGGTNGLLLNPASTIKV